MSTPYIILRQTRVEKTLASTSGPFLHTIIDFEPIIPKGKKEAHILSGVETAEEALALAKVAYPHFNLAVQPALEYLQCHQKPKLSQPSPSSSGQKPGTSFPEFKQGKQSPSMKSPRSSGILAES